jgi:hypothetical protein
METWILILITTLGPNKILYDPYLETTSEPACRKQAEFVRLRQPEVQTFCVKKR